MDGTTLALFLAATIIPVAILIGIGVYYLNHNFFNPTGKGASWKTRRKLQKYAVIRRFKVLSDVTVASGGKSAHVENMLIGFFGILMVHTCGARGSYYGSLDGENWILELDNSRATIPNPFHEMQRATTILRESFAQHKIYNVPVEHIVYVTNRSKKTAIYITNSGEILMPGKLGAYLDKTKFDRDLGFDVEKIAEAVADFRVETAAK